MSFRSFIRGCFLTAFCVLVLSARADAADEKIRIGVAAFGSKADGISDSQAAIITDLFTFDLTQSKAISVVERESIDRIGQELKLGMSGLVDPMTAAEIGKIAGVKYMLLGSITQVDQKASGGGFLIIGTSTHEMRATIDMRVVDVSTAEIVMALRADGTAKNDSTAFSYGGFTHVESEFGGIQARAIANAVSKLSAEVRGEIGGEHPRVVSLTSDGFALDIAAPSVGALYLAYVDGKTIHGLDGEVLGRDKLPIAILKVSAVNVGYSVANVVPQGGNPKNVQRGDKLEPISQARAKELIPKMPKDRPRTSGSAAAALLDGDTKQTGVKTFDDSETTEPAELSGTAETEEPSAEAAPATIPAPKDAGAPKSAPTPKTVEGIDPNTETDAKLIGTFPLSQGDRNVLGIQHRSAFKMYSAKRYKDALELFSKLSDDYDCNYLSAYWAGMTSLKLKDKQAAAGWFDRALAINPDYEPAKKEREKL